MVRMGGEYTVLLYMLFSTACFYSDTQYRQPSSSTP
jgi:hypothetical protein